ncbi:arf-GAP with dual PH domain-containing protein 1-like [Mizuhopecten yessoensis]|uniref:Arf-GAP with dual PH domain-containing protein 1 n=1 Tax=Mizuhopecten yessoensis TaxID=6573 RepID=A0A210PFK7_MIZYE|nr:arf-GAP with dual PH domain-containing protein 1-like [Mizuhopecten yessoensis]OWF35241.1 Arf-GAP with dual PH domain-containing protein 1 [Mizuhopecten yessoensis]
MADTNRHRLLNLLAIPGNNTCAECGEANPEWASCNVGIFLCERCAGLHRGLGVDISRVKSIRLDNWDSDHVKTMEAIGNEKANALHEKHRPAFYKKPTRSDPQILLKEWICAKYSRKEFDDVDRQLAYTSTTKEGILMKRGKDDKKYNRRKFVLSRPENKMIYYQKDTVTSRPKAEICLDDINLVFVPGKMQQANGLQITYLLKGSTRNIFVYTDDSKDIVDWYLAIRAAKLERRKIAFPDRDEKDLAEDLTQDFIMEGYLSKMGPKNQPFKKRWFSLDKRKLMYYEDKLNPFPKGERFIGHRDGEFSVSMRAAEARPTQGYAFTLHMPGRDFILSAETREDMDQWICALQKVIETPLTPQDTKIASQLVPKRHEPFISMKK